MALNAESVLADVNSQKSDDYFRGLGFDKGRQGAMDWLHTQRQEMGGITLQEKQDFQRKQQQEAIAPVVSSLEGQIPEIKQKYDTRQSQLEAEKDPLKLRYEHLLNEIRGRETSQVNEVTRNTNREMGRRGIALSSTFASDELQGRTAPIRSEAGNLISNTVIAREGDLRSIDNEISNLEQAEIADIRETNKTIANLKASANQAGIDTAIRLYELRQQERESALNRVLEERRITIAEQEANKVENKLISVGKDSFLYDPTTGEFKTPPKSSTGTGSGTGTEQFYGNTKSSLWEVTP